MFTLIISLVVLIAGYLFYSKYIERVFGADPNRPTPATTMPDGVDYLPMPWWRIFLIQFLNIAGLGPIFGAVAGAMWGPVAYLWIILGSVFAGAVHDYFSGMLSIKHKGLSITEIVGIYLGTATKQFMRGFTVLLMVIVGAVFILGPAKILAGMTPGYATMTFWVWAVFFYYILSTLLLINKVIGRIYPVFGFALLFMAVALIIALFVKGYPIPELTMGSFKNLHGQAETFPVFPMLFITIACGNQLFVAEKSETSPYVQEHINWITCIRQDIPFNEAEQTAISNMVAIMGRVSAYTGKEVTYDEMMNSDMKLGPSIYLMDKIGFIEKATVSVPGTFKKS